jgi:hypothetical protein
MIHMYLSIEYIHLGMCTTKFESIQPSIMSRVSFESVGICLCYQYNTSDSAFLLNSDQNTLTYRSMYTIEIQCCQRSVENIFVLDPLLPRVTNFIKLFPQYLRIVSHCTRKTEVALWPCLFSTSIIGDPKKLFQVS